MTIACPFIVRTDCKGVFNLCNGIFNNRGYDHKHNDADLLHHIDALHKASPLKRIIEWMPAHLDEEANAKKLKKFLKGGGTQTHINGNCSVDSLAKAEPTASR